MAKKRGRPNWEGDDSGADESEPETSLARPPKRRQTTSAWWGRPFSSVVSALSNLLWTPDAVAPNGASESGTEGVRVYTLSSVTVERTERGPDAGVVTGTCSDVEEDVTSASIVSRCGTRIIITPPSDTASVVDLDSDEETVATVPISECFEEVVEEEIQETRTETVLGEEEKAAADEPITLDDLIEEEPSTRVERDTVGGDRVIHKEPEVIVIDDDSDCVPSVDIEPPTSPHSTEADEAKRLPSDIPSRDDGYHPFFEPQRTGRPAKRDDNSQPDSLQRLNGDSHVEYPSPEDSPEKGAKSFSNAATPNAGIRTLRRNEEKENFMGRQSVFTVRSQDSSLAGSTASSFGRSSLSRSILKPKSKKEREMNRLKLLRHFMPDRWGAALKVRHPGRAGDFSLRQSIAGSLRSRRTNNQRPGILRPDPVSLEHIQARIQEYKFLKPKIDVYRKTQPLPAKVSTPLYDELLAKQKKVEEQLKSLRLEISKGETEEEYPALTEEQEDEIDDALESDPRAVVADAFKIKISTRDLRTLMDGNWLNDEIINIYGQLIMHRAQEDINNIYPKIHCFNTFFYANMSKNYNLVRKWTKKIDIFALDYVIVPVHLGNHWTCSVLNFKEKRVEYYDSLHGSAANVLRIMRSYLEQESMDKKKQKFDFSAWTDYAPRDCPAQLNGNDCGVFTCLFMEYTAREQHFDFDGTSMPYFRRRIMWEIMKTKLM